MSLAQSFTIGLNEVARTIAGGSPAPSYQGINLGRGDRRGAVLDGGSDAYDDAGYFADDLPALGLTLSRRTDTLASLNVFRWIDTFTNTLAVPIHVSLTMESNLGSDSLTRSILNDPLRTVTYEDRPDSTDPILGMMHGNNPVAHALVIPERNAGFLSRRLLLDLQPNQSITFMFADVLVRDLSDRSGDPALALSSTAFFIADPALLATGLSPTEVNRIANWTIPSPGATTAVLVPLVWLTARRRSAAPGHR